MMERIKSGTLVFLVLFSLLQSYLLVFGSPPKQAMLPQNDYVETDLIGTQSTVEELVRPEQLILHNGKQIHTLLYPNHAHYNEILKMMKSRTFDSFRRLPVALTQTEWEDVRNKHIGVEVRFRNGVPFSILRSVFQLKGDIPIEVDTVNRIWIYVNKENEDVRTYFVTEYATYEARADLNNKNVEQMVGFGELQGTYHVKDDLYLPDQPMEMARYVIATQTMPVDQLQKLLFVDPGNTRNFRNREGSDSYYTDGKRGLQIKPDQMWMIYTDPVASVGTRNETRENLNVAVQFINQHGGWNGDFIAQSIPSSLGRQQFTFRQYYDSFPIISEHADNYGLIRVVLQNRIVANYERSIVMLDESKIERSLDTLVGGEALDALLANDTRRNSIVDVMPAYEPILHNNMMELRPVWAAELQDGSYHLLR